MELELIQPEAPPRPPAPNLPLIEPVPLHFPPSPLLLLHAEHPVSDAAKIPSPPKMRVVRVPSQARSAPISGKTKTQSASSKGAIAAVPDDLHNAPPEYPEESRLDREEGLVVLRVKVTPQGETVSVEIFRSSGYFRLDQAARRAVGQWRFHPATLAGEPVSSEVETPVRFKLE